MDNEMIQGSVQAGVSATTVPVNAAPKTQIRALDTVFVWIALVLGFLTVRYAVFSPNGFLTSAASLLIFACSSVYIIRSGNRPTARQWLLGAVVCVFSLIFSFTANVGMHFLGFLFLIAAHFWWVQAVAVKARFVTRYFLSDLLRTMFCQPVLDITAAPRAMKASMKGSEKAGAVRNAVLGVIFTVPLTLVVAALLADADSGIEQMMQEFTKVFTNNVLSTVLQVVLAFPAGFIIFSMMRADSIQKLYPLPSDIRYHEKFSRLAFIPQSAVFAGVTPICLLYIMYVVSQANYFLSAFAGRLPADMMYSEYARRGFFELCGIAVINFAVIIAMLAFSKKREEKPSAALKAYTCILSGLTLFIISTALAKMFMYVGEFGLTRLRLYTSWFMVLLAVIFITLVIRAFVPRFRTSAVISASFIVLFGLLCFSRPDAVIAEYNITRYEQGALDKLDVETLCELSDDAYVVMLQHYDTVKDIKWSEYWGGEKTVGFDEMLSRKSDDYDGLRKYNISSMIVSEAAKARENEA